MPDESKYAYKTIRGSERDAQRELRKITSEIDSGDFISPNALTVEDCLKKFLASRTPPIVGKKTYQEYVSKINHHLIPAFGKRKLNDLGLDDIQEWINTAQVSGGVNGKGISSQTIKHVITILHSAMQHCCNLDLLRKNPVIKSRLTMPDVRKLKYPDLTRDQIIQLLGAFVGTKWEIGVYICALTGCRRGEALASRWSLLSLEEKTMTISHSLSQTKEGVFLTNPKTESSSAIIAIPDVLVEKLKEHKKKQDEQKLIAGEAYVDNDYVCADELGKCLSPNLFSWMFSYYVDKLKLPHVRLHDLRHQMAQVLRKISSSGEGKRIDTKTISGILRHSSTQITENLYQHKDIELEREALQEFENFLKIDEK